MSEEEWRPVFGYEGLYEVSDQGRVRSWMAQHGNVREEPWILTGSIDRYGYRHVMLYGKEKRKFPTVHSLVLGAFFIGPILPGSVCRHLGGVSSHNFRENLQWGTHKQNYDDRRRHGTDNASIRTSKMKLDDDKVRYIREMYPEISVRELSAKFQVVTSVIYGVIHRKSWRRVA